MVKGYFDRNPSDRYSIINSKTKQIEKFGRKIMNFRTYAAAERFLFQYFNYGEFEIKDNFPNSWRNNKNGKK